MALAQIAASASASRVRRGELDAQAAVAFDLLIAALPWTIGSYAVRHCGPHNAARRQNRQNRQNRQRSIFLPSMSQIEIERRSHARADRTRCL
jgi:hypothetical protein